MTAYVNFIQDFPKRCNDLLDIYLEDATFNNREVTLILAVASAAFVIPFERLRPSSHKHVAEDRTRPAVRKLGKLLNKSFYSWVNGAAWETRDSIPGYEIRNAQIDAWYAPDHRRKLHPGRTVDTILSHLRNSLAHGNIFLYPSNSGGHLVPQIDNLVFLARNKDKKSDELVDKYNVLSTSPPQFLQFVRLWIAYLGRLQLPTAVQQEHDLGVTEFLDVAYTIPQ